MSHKFSLPAVEGSAAPADQAFEFNVVIDFPTVDAMANCEAQIDITDPETVQRLASQPRVMAQAIYTCCAAQAIDRGIDPTAFGRRLTFCFPQAREAWLEAATNFFQLTGQATLAAVLAKALELCGMGEKQGAELVNRPSVNATLTQMFEQMGPELDSQLAALVGGKTFSGSPELRESGRVAFTGSPG